MEIIKSFSRVRDMADIDCEKCGYHYPSDYSECTICHGTGKQDDFFSNSKRSSPFGKAQGKRTSTWEDKRYRHICKFCSIEFRSRMPFAKYCSNNHRKKAWAKSERGKLYKAQEHKKYYQKNKEKLSRYSKNWLSNKIKSEKEKSVRETIDLAFDWIWSGWNLDLGNKDRAKKHFMNKLSSLNSKGRKTGLKSED